MGPASSTVMDGTESLTSGSAVVTKRLDEFRNTLRSHYKGFICSVALTHVKAALCNVKEYIQLNTISIGASLEQ